MRFRRARTPSPTTIAEQLPIDELRGGRAPEEQIAFIRGQRDEARRKVAESERQVERLEQWRAEALEVLDRWDAVHDALGGNAPVRGSIPEWCAAEVRRLVENARTPYGVADYRVDPVCGNECQPLAGLGDRPPHVCTLHAGHADSHRSADGTTWTHLADGGRIVMPPLDGPTAATAPDDPVAAGEARLEAASRMASAPTGYVHRECPT